MHTVTSVHASAVRPEQLKGLIADWLILQRAGIRRKMLARGFAVVAAIVAVAGFSSLSVLGFCFSLGLCAAVPLWAWTVELGHERRLACRLDAMPETLTYVTGHATAPLEPAGRKS